MVDRTTDGASTATVDPGSRSDAWESVLGSAIAESGIDPTATLDQLADPDEATPQPDELESSAPSGATPREAAGDDGAAPTGAPDPASPDGDPLATAEAFTYPGANGEPQTVDGAYRIPGEGLYVPEDKVPAFQQIATQAATYERQVRELTDRTQSFERLTAWQTTDAQGKVMTLTGAPALAAQRVVLARSLATSQAFEPLMKGDVDPASLVVWDEQGQRLVWDAQALTDFRDRMKFEADKAEFNASRHFDKLGATPPPPEPAVSSFAAPTIDQLIRDHQISGLTDADKQFLAGQFEPYVRTTAQGRAVDPRFLDVMKDRAAIRAEHAKVASASATAGKFNNGMKSGLPAPKAPARPATAAAPTQPAKVGKAAQWDAVFQTAMSEIVV